MAIEINSNYSSLEHKKDANSIAMIVLLVSWSMLFGSLFLGYTLLRFSEKTWPPTGFERVDLFLPTISSILILLSSVSLEWFKRSYENGKSIYKLGWALTFILGMGFLLSQKFLWNEMNASGLMVSTGTFASILHSFTWVHAAHIVMAILGLLYLLHLFFKPIEQKHEQGIINITKFWHFLGLIWVIMYVTLFII